MDFKVILYIIFGIGYFIYTSYTKAKEEEAKKLPKTPQAPKQPSTFDEVIRRIQQELQENKQNTTPKTVAPQPKKQEVFQPKNKGLLQETAAFNYEEGFAEEAKYERPLTSEEILYNERMKAINAKQEEIIQEETTEPYQFNAREAMIGSIIFERKF